MRNYHIPAEKIILYVLNELPENERKTVDTHLDTCHECQNLLKEESCFVQSVKNQPHKEPEESSLARCRNRLNYNLQQEVNRKNQKKFSIHIGEYVSIRLPIKRLAVATFIFFIGLVLGRVLPIQNMNRDSAMEDAMNALQSSMLVSHFQIIPSPDKPNEIEVRFHTLQEKRLRGDLNDPEIQYVLSYALVNEPRDNIRLKSVGLLDPSVMNNTMHQALIHALEHDSNPGVRLKAIKLIKTLPIDDSTKEILISALFQDPNAGVRIEAANALSQTADPNIRPILQNKAAEDEYISTLISKTREPNEISISREQ